MKDNSKPITFETLSCPDKNKIGILNLNKPEKLNALSLDMVEMLFTQLSKWKDDKRIVCVIIRSLCDKAFCAGGDVRAVYDAIQNDEDAVPFFIQEYQLDHLIQTYPKPVVTWGHGIVMGGGMGIFMGGDLRVVTEKTQAAMPEVSIGFHADVGAGFFLSKIPSYAGRFLAITGATINSADCIELELAQYFIRQRYYQEAIEMLQEQIWSNDKEENIEVIASLLESFHIDSEEKLPEAQLDKHHEKLEAIFEEKDSASVVKKLLAYKTSDAWFKQTQQKLAKSSPLSIIVNDKRLQTSHKDSLRESFLKDMILSSQLIKHNDFSEGVRALLVDKDMQAQWQHESVDDISDDDITTIFTAPWEQNPLEQKI